MTETLPTKGYLGHLTEPQEQALKEITDKISKDEHFNSKRHTPQFLLRFLRARDFNVEKAFNMLLQYEIWRKEEKVDELVKTFEFTELEKVADIYPQYYHGVDKLGRPVYIEHFGKFNLNGLMAVTSMERMKTRLIVEYEKLLDSRFPACSQNSNTTIELSCTILDMKDVSVWGATKLYSFIREITQIGQNYYPEVMGKMMIVNAPYMFSGIWKIVSGMIDENTRKKIDVLSEKESVPKIMEVIEPRYVPKSLGGTCNCDVACHLRDYGPWNEKCGWQK